MANILLPSRRGFLSSIRDQPSKFGYVPDMSAVFYGVDNPSYLQEDFTATTSNAQTLCAWVKPYTYNSGCAVWNGDKDSSTDYNAVQSRAAERSYSAVGRTSTTAYHAIGRNNAVTPGKWTHICNRTASTSNRNIYIDGELHATNTNAANAAGEDRVSIGRYGDATPSAYWFGEIAYACIWLVALSGDQIKNLARGMTPVQAAPASMAAYYPLQGNSRAFDGIGSDLTINVNVHFRHIKTSPVIYSFPAAAPAGTTPKGPLGHPLHGPFGGPI